MNRPESQNADDGEKMAAQSVFARIAGFKQRFGEVALCGNIPDFACELAEDSGWKVCPAASAPVLILWTAEGETLPRPGDFPNAHVLIIAEVPQDLEPDTWNKVLDRPAKIYLSLNQCTDRFVRRLGIPQSIAGPCAGLLRSSGVSNVVGSRICGLKSATMRTKYYIRPGSVEGMLRTSRSDSLKDLVMSFFKIGHIPLFAANFASLVTAGVLFVVFLLAGPAAMLVTAGVFIFIGILFGLLLESWSARYYFAKDAREVVIDEVAGMSVTLLFLPTDTGVLHFFTGFLLFRFFDIFKWGVHWVEEMDWHGGVVWDDILAGIYAGVCLLLLGIIF